jgi:hypothetical protein
MSGLPLEFREPAVIDQQVMEQYPRTVAGILTNPIGGILNALGNAGKGREKVGFLRVLHLQAWQLSGERLDPTKNF